MTKVRLTPEQHTRIGMQLAHIRNQLTGLHVEVAGAYPLNGPEARPGRKLNTAIKTIDEARSLLEEAHFLE